MFSWHDFLLIYKQHLNFHFFSLKIIYCLLKVEMQFSCCKSFCAFPSLKVLNFCIFLLCLFVKLSSAGGRIIISSDGVWDALTAEMALDCCRGMSAEAAAPHIVKVCTSFT